MMRRYLFIALLASTLAACDTTEPSLHEPEPVVEAYLVGGETFPPVRLTETADVEAVYDSNTLGLTGAEVFIHRLNAAGAVEETMGYQPDLDLRGVYVPEGTASVENSTRYRLEARLQDGSLVSSETFVPGAYEILQESGTSAVYQGQDQFRVNVSRSAYPGRQSIYVITLESQEPTISNLTPFYLDAIYDIRDGDSFNPDSLDLTELEEFYEGSSPPINEASWDEGPDNSVVLKLPWFAVAFFGPTRVEFNAIDDNLNDFFRFQTAQAGGSTLSPGELPNILDSVEGGTGVFGSMARQEVIIDILRP